MLAFLHLFPNSGFVQNLLMFVWVFKLFLNSGFVQDLALFGFRICSKFAGVHLDFWIFSEFWVCTNFSIYTNFGSNRLGFFQNFFGVCLGFSIYEFWDCTNFVSARIPTFFRICWYLFRFLNFFRIMHWKEEYGIYW